MIYFFRGKETGLVKIGITKDLCQRVKQVGEPVEVMAVLFVKHKPDREVERGLHEKFQHLAVFGEWFSDDGSIKALVDILLEYGLALSEEDAMNTSSLTLMLELMRDQMKTQRAIEDEYLKAIDEAAEKRQRNMRLSKIAEFDDVDA